ncbi:MAG: TetR family transcriptional regulator [candidate division Zixibacteria bacterium]|nr:TetR family transcriptional regulator [candidate division Zixibacteria bacterium]
MRKTSQERKAQIIDLATSMFARYGYARVTTKMLASACGISESALYKHFESKESIYREVLNHLREKMELSELDRAISPESDVEKILFAVARHLIGNFTENTELWRLLLYSSLENHELSRQVFQTIRMPYIKILSRKLSKMIKSGQVRKVNPEITARCFVGMVMDCNLGLNLWKNIQKQDFGIDEIINNTIPIYAQGLKEAK